MKKILVVEDDAKVLVSLAARLKASGYEVRQAKNEMDGLKIALREKPDLILSDIWMPRGLGLSLALILEEKNYSDVPIIFLTAGKQDGLHDAAMEAGAAAFFEKPCDSKTLLRAIHQILEDESPASCFADAI